MIFVDTGPIVARYLKNDQHHSRAISTWNSLEKNESEPLVITSLVLAETANLLAKRASPAFSAARATNILRSNVFQLIRPVLEIEEQALGFMERLSDQGVSFTDCVSFAAMKARGIRRVFTFDRHFDLLGFERFPLT